MDDIEAMAMKSIMTDQRELTSEQMAFSKAVVAQLDDFPLYHGGVGGLLEGQTILPLERLLSSIPAGPYTPPEAARYAYFTPWLPDAVQYSKRRNFRGVYRVKPLGEIHVDPVMIRIFMEMGLTAKTMAGDPRRIDLCCADGARIVEVMGR